MAAVEVRELGRGRQLLDLGFHDSEGLIASYLLPGIDGDWALVETGPESCHTRLDAGLARAGVEREEVRDVFLTHIHLDHAGGAGSLLARYPRAIVHVHAAGAPHLIDPSRLVASARRAWGEASATLWGPIEPADPHRVHELHGGESFPLRDGALDVIGTPGHARHHVSFFDRATRAILTGDSAGVRLPGGWRPRPAVPPPDLDLEALFESLDRMAGLEPAEVWFSHFGPSPDGPSDLARYRTAVTEWRDAGLATARTDPRVESVARALADAERSAAERDGIHLPPGDPGAIISGYSLAAQGLLRYFRLHGLLPE